MTTLSSKLINYSQASGPVVTVEYPIAASQAFKYASGKFVILDANERLDIADSGDTRLLGWAQAGEFTSNATAGVDKVSVNISREALYWIPADAPVTRDLVGKLCDLIVASDIQKADVGESTEDVLRIYDVDITNQLVLVGIWDTTAPAGVV